MFIFIINNNIVLSYDCMYVKRLRTVLIDLALYKYFYYYYYLGDGSYFFRFTDPPTTFW